MSAIVNSDEIALMQKDLQNTSCLLRVVKYR